MPRSSHTFCPLPHLAALLGSSPLPFAALKAFCFASDVADHGGLLRDLPPRTSETAGEATQRVTQEG